MTDVTIIFMNRIENRSEYLASIYFDKYLRVLIVVKYLPSKKEWMKRITTTTLFRHKQFINNIKIKKGVGMFSQYHHPCFSTFFQTRTASNYLKDMYSFLHFWIHNAHSTCPGTFFFNKTFFISSIIEMGRRKVNILKQYGGVKINCIIEHS